MGTSSVSRRDFIKASAVSVAAMGMTSRMYAAGSDTIRVGLIGCGGQGTRDLISCVKSTPGVEIVALGDLFEDRLKESIDKLTQGSARRPEGHAGQAVRRFRRV